ncbi:MAG TPA: hypothetical protein VFJ25_04620 [Casimicrobiaceae bacterium]|nr:hypothetical protein [Casimicrobiaceae bacterium]
MRLFDWLASRNRRCVVAGCTRPPHGRGNLCAEHELELGEKIRRVVERVRVNHRQPSGGDA